jgi:hypothetical protein
MIYTLSSAAAGQIQSQQEYKTKTQKTCGQKQKKEQIIKKLNRLILVLSKF